MACSARHAACAASGAAAPPAWPRFSHAPQPYTYTHTHPHTHTLFAWLPCPVELLTILVAQRGVTARQVKEARRVHLSVVCSSGCADCSLHAEHRRPPYAGALLQALLAFGRRRRALSLRRAQPQPAVHTPHQVGRLAERDSAIAVAEAARYLPGRTTASPATVSWHVSWASVLSVLPAHADLWLANSQRRNWRRSDAMPLH